MSDDKQQAVLNRLAECIDQHNRTGYSGILKWVELLATRELIAEQQERIEELEAEVLRLKNQWKRAFEGRGSRQG